MPVATPPVASDLLARVNALLPARWLIAGATRNAWWAPEMPSVSTGVPALALFGTFVDERKHRHGDGAIRFMDVHLLIRTGKDGFADGLAYANELHDALDVSGAFTVGPRSYIDVRFARAFAHIDESANGFHYFAGDAEVWFDG